MDPRRFLIPAACGLLLSGCALLRPSVAPELVAAPPPAPITAPAEEPAVPTPEPASAEVAEVGAEADGARPYVASADPPGPERRVEAASGRPAIASANASARAASRSDAFVGGVQVFAWSPGRVFEVWAAPLRVTTLSLSPGETLTAKAAGDTVRWQIGETESGEGPGRRVHVMIKPLERGLETNLVLTTNRRVYLIDLKSGPPDAFNAAVAWDEPGVEAVASQPNLSPDGVPRRIADAPAMPGGAIDARYRIQAQGRVRWTPTAVFNDGLRTFITFDPDLQADEAPALFAVGPDGQTQLVNYRQAGGLFIVDRVLEQAELRLGDRRPQVVRIRRLTGASS